MTQPDWTQGMPVVETALYDYPDITEAAAQHYGRTVRRQDGGGWRAVCECGEWTSLRRDDRDHAEYDHARHIAAAVLTALLPVGDVLTALATVKLGNPGG